MHTQRIPNDEASNVQGPWFNIQHSREEIKTKTLVNSKRDYECTPEVTLGELELGHIDNYLL